MIVIYPFSPGDQEQALKNALWMRELGSVEKHDIFVLSDPRCDPEIVNQVVKAFTGVFKVTHPRVAKSQVDGWPAGANYMFSYACTLIQFEKEWPYFFWLEPDAIPLREGWLDALEIEHACSGKKFMGEKVDLGHDRPDVPIHMSGVAIYPNPIYMYAGEAYRANDAAWDIAAKDQIIPQAHWTKLIQHYWKHGTFIDLSGIRPEAVVFHSSKDGSLIDILRSQRDNGGRDGAAVARLAHNQEAVGSNPTPATIKKLPHGVWVIEGDTIISKYVETTGRLDFDQLIPHITSLIRPGDTVVDVGAFIGDHTIAYSHAVGPTGNVMAYEPCLPAFQCLVHNTEMCGNVFTFSHALGASPDVVRMVTSPNAASNYIGGVEGDNIIVRPLDEAVSLFERLDLIKIDVEGYELKVLNGAEKLIEKFHPTMVVEINPEALQRQFTTPEDVVSWLVRHGYQVSVLYRHPESPFYDILCVPQKSPEMSQGPESVHTARPSDPSPVAVRQPTIREEIAWHVEVLRAFCEHDPQTKAIVMQKLVYAGLRLPNKNTKKKHATSKTHKQTNGSGGATA